MRWPDINAVWAEYQDYGTKDKFAEGKRRREGRSEEPVEEEGNKKNNLVGTAFFKRNYLVY